MERILGPVPKECLVDDLCKCPANFVRHAWDAWGFQKHQEGHAVCHGKQEVSVLQKYQAVVKGLTVDDLMAFVSGLKAELYTEGLVQGNFTSTESRGFLQYFTQKLQYQPLSAEVPVLFRVVELPQKNHLCKVKSLNKGDANSEVTVYYQSGLKNLREHALMELMVMHMEEPCFDFLRTKETLGYQVYPTCRNTSGVLGFSVTVETQATKFSTEFVEAKIQEFLVSFGERLASLSEEAFRTQVTALIKLKECEDAHLGEEVDRNWCEVVTQQYVFDRLNKEIQVLKHFTQEELVSWFLEHRNTSSRKLSVHVVGFGVEENDPTDQSVACGSDGSDNPPTSSYGEVSELTFLSASSPSLQDATLISDIRAFTPPPPLHPYHKILSLATPTAERQQTPLKTDTVTMAMTSTRNHTGQRGRV
ncbi:nardilysin-like [Limanda limanda]|uniref:nardilysin-like n=1 Tax=Limanda limanda TaxID=27771 RepID=UPI0029C690B3|nr:nardilysin-like [Limanda limanda]